MTATYVGGILWNKLIKMENYREINGRKGVNRGGKEEEGKEEEEVPEKPPPPPLTGGPLLTSCCCRAAN